MNKDQKKGLKKKARARKSHAKVLKIREAIRRERKKTMQEAYLEESLKPKQKPFMYDREKQLESQEVKDEKIKEQLQKNKELLESLEAQYDEEQANRKRINESLESEGNMSLQEKLKAMHQKTLESHEHLNNPEAQAKIDPTEQQQNK